MAKREELKERIRLYLVHLKYTLQNETHWTEWKYWTKIATFLPIFASEWTYLTYWTIVHLSLNQWVQGSSPWSVTAISGSSKNFCSQIFCFKGQDYL